MATPKRKEKEREEKRRKDLLKKRDTDSREKSKEQRENPVFPRQIEKQAENMQVANIYNSYVNKWKL